MTKERCEFKNKFLVDAFFWITEENHMVLQKILQEFGILCHTGGGAIEWHTGFRCLATFIPDSKNNFEYYQKVDVWIPGARYGDPKDVALLIKEHKALGPFKISQS